MNNDIPRFEISNSIANFVLTNNLKVTSDSNVDSINIFNLWIQKESIVIKNLSTAVWALSFLNDFLKTDREFLIEFLRAA